MGFSFHGRLTHIRDRTTAAGKPGKWRRVKDLDDRNRAEPGQDKRRLADHGMAHYVGEREVFGKEVWVAKDVHGRRSKVAALPRLPRRSDDLFIGTKIIPQHEVSSFDPRHAPDHGEMKMAATDLVEQIKATVSRDQYVALVDCATGSTLVAMGEVQGFKDRQASGVGRFRARQAVRILIQVYQDLDGERLDEVAEAQPLAA